MDVNISSIIGMLMGSLIKALIVMAILHFYLGACLSVMARKMGREDGYLGFIPIGNLVLMCRLGGRSGAYFLWLLLPILGFIPIWLLWGNIAKARGRSAGVGLCVIIPIFGLFVPAILAGGPPSAGATTSQGLPPQAPANLPGVVPANPSVCPACGSTECVGGEFCAYTGQRIAGLATAAPAPVQTMTPAAKPVTGSGAWVKVLSSLAGVAVLAVGTFIHYNQPSSAKRVQPAMPERMAGTMREFPVDTSTSNPAKPVSVVTRNLNPNHPPVLPPNTMPPGITTRELPQYASTMTSVVYKSSDQDPGGNVHVLAPSTDSLNMGTPPDIRQLGSQVMTASGSDAVETGVQTISPTGVEYEGIKIAAPAAITYLFIRPDTNTIIIMYANSPAALPETDRLAANLGNGAGLMDSPVVGGALSTLPPTPPPGLELSSVDVFTHSEMQTAINQVIAEIDPNGSNGLGGIEQQVQSLLPAQLTVAQYGANGYRGSQSNSTVIVGDYGSPFGAMSRWLLVRNLLRIPGLGVQAQEFQGMSALVIGDESSRWMLMHKGQFIAIVNVPAQMPAESLSQLASSLQIQ